jgi:hypothetical protein
VDQENGKLQQIKGGVSRFMRRPRSKHNAIEYIVAELLRRHNITHLPVPVELIARSLGANLSYHPYEGELSGMLFHDSNRTVIGINSLHHPNPQRFTIAHECAHLLLHKSQEVFMTEVRSDLIAMRNLVKGRMLTKLRLIDLPRSSLCQESFWKRTSRI